MDGLLGVAGIILDSYYCGSFPENSLRLAQVSKEMDRPKTTLANLPEVAMEKERERNINDKERKIEGKSEKKKEQQKKKEDNEEKINIF